MWEADFSEISVSCVCICICLEVHRCVCVCRRVQWRVEVKVGLFEGRGLREGSV